MKKTAVITAVLMTCVSAANAQPQCAPRGIIIEGLADQYGEFVQVDGLTARGEIMEIYANPETGTWTAVVTNPHGTSCIMTDGEGFTASKGLRGAAL